MPPPRRHPRDSSGCHRSVTGLGLYDTEGKVAFAFDIAARMLVENWFRSEKLPVIFPGHELEEIRSLSDRYYKGVSEDVEETCFCERFCPEESEVSDSPSQCKEGKFET